MGFKVTLPPGWMGTIERKAAEDTAVKHAIDEVCETVARGWLTERDLKFAAPFKVSKNLDFPSPEPEQLEKFQRGWDKLMTAWSFISNAWAFGDPAEDDEAIATFEEMRDEAMREIDESAYKGKVIETTVYGVDQHGQKVHERVSVKVGETAEGRLQFTIIGGDDE